MGEHEGLGRTEVTPAFIPGVELSRLFYREAVLPLLGDLPHSAARIGSGSDVLGYDDVMSTDHDWGCRLQLFLPDESLIPEVDRRLRTGLPRQVHGYPTGFTEPDPTDNGTRHWETGEGEVNHNVDLTTIEAYALSRMGVVRPEGTDWLAIPEQRLLSMVSGEVFHDDLGLADLRAFLAYFPRDVWLYLLASWWTRIEQEQHLMGRAGFAGDEIGSALIGARLVRDVMRLAFLYERRYAPYPKWFGTAFTRLPMASRLKPHLAAALQAQSWQERESGLTGAYAELAQRHHEDRDLPQVDWRIGPFFGRPFRVILGDFSQVITRSIEDEDMRSLAGRRLIGGVDTLSDNTDLLEDVRRHRALSRLWTADSE